jgi:uncharacterized protein (TIGR03790 family)
MACPPEFRYAQGGRWVAVVMIWLAATAFAQGPQNVLLVVNDNSSVSRSIGEYYTHRRSIPQSNICHIRSSAGEEITRADYDQTVALPIRRCLETKGIVESILYIVTTKDVPLRVAGDAASVAAVDSELALLYSDIKFNRPHQIPGTIPNPFFGRMNARFTHPEFPIYLVTRLAAYDFAGVRDMIDRGMRAVNRGKFVIDRKSPLPDAGDDWFQKAADLLPADRVILDASYAVLYEQTDVIGYAGWGSNDKSRHRRFLGFQWLPGAIMTEFVSTNARTFHRPPDSWNISDWEHKELWWEGSPQSLSSDYILEGATGASGHVAEPYLGFTPHPEFVLPAYWKGRNLAESFYLGIPALSWQNVVIGDPLVALVPVGR